jgi:transcriptional regulator with XRE-family HTH domain
MALGNNLRRLRNTQKFTQKEFGELFGLSRGMVDTYERNAVTPSPATIIKIADYFKISPMEMESCLEAEVEALYLARKSGQDMRVQIAHPNQSLEETSMLRRIIAQQQEHIDLLKQKLQQLTKNVHPG